jgi:RNA polymerase sigma-70 factor (ECF subfamily)
LISGTEEIQLIRKALDGNQGAFQKLYEAHVEGLFLFLNQFSKEREQVKDWTQRAFIKAFQKLDSFKKDARFKTWLYTIGMNEMRTDMRSKIRFVELDDQLREVPEDDVTESELWSTARNAIQNLPPEKKMVVLLHIAEGYSHREIGEMLSIKEGHSRIILHRAKEELRNMVLS